MKKWVLVTAMAFGLAVTLWGLTYAPTAAAATEVTTVYPVSVNCVPPTGQLCSPSFSVSPTTSGILRVQFTASAGHCSKIRVFVYFDGVLAMTSQFLDPGQSTPVLDVSLVTPGVHQISVQAEGTTQPITGGGTCNSGNLAGWAGSLTVVTSTGEIEEPPLTVEQQRPFRFGGGGAAAAVVAAAGKASAANRARAAAAAQPAPAPTVTAPSTGTGIRLPNTGDGGLVASTSSRPGLWMWLALGLTAVGASGTAMLALGARRRA
jgi:hypothetical protein